MASPNPLATPSDTKHPALGFIGYGKINATIARIAVANGYEVAISNSRGPESLSDAVSELGESARAATVEDVVDYADVVFVALGMAKFDSLPSVRMADKVVVDVSNYYPQRDGHIDVLDKRALTSSEFVAQALSAPEIVKAFHNIDYQHLGNGPRPEGSLERWALPVAGDDAAAKQTVMDLMRRFGFDPVDCGTLADSWRTQAGTPLHVLPYMGELPEGTFDERREWLKQEHTATVRPDDVIRLAAQAIRSDRPYGLVEDLPAEFSG